MENKQKTIYDLELHEMIKVGNVYTVIKVHGGFIYRYESLKTTNSTFVPYEEPIRDSKAAIEVPQSLIDACENIPEDKSYLWNENEKKTD